MRALVFTLFLFLSACYQPVNHPERQDDANLPSSSQMATEGTVASPAQVKEFCAENPEFEACV